MAKRGFRSQHHDQKLEFCVVRFASWCSLRPCLVRAMRRRASQRFTSHPINQAVGGVAQDPGISSRYLPIKAAGLSAESNVTYESSRLCSAQPLFPLFYFFFTQTSYRLLLAPIPQALLSYSGIYDQANQFLGCNSRRAHPRIVWSMLS